jgi:hypothetical protein
MRRGTAGTSPQHRTKSSIRHMDNLRISDDRALKVAEVHPGKPHASRIAGCSKITGIGGSRSSQTPGAAWTFTFRQAASQTPERGGEHETPRREGSRFIQVSEPQGEPIAYGESA